jgi:hypothetical protein
MRVVDTEHDGTVMGTLSEGGSSAPQQIEGRRRTRRLRWKEMRERAERDRLRRLGRRGVHRHTPDPLCRGERLAQQARLADSRSSHEHDSACAAIAQDRRAERHLLLPTDQWPGRHPLGRREQRRSSHGVIVARTGLGLKPPLCGPHQAVRYPSERAALVGAGSTDTRVGTGGCFRSSRWTRSPSIRPTAAGRARADVRRTRAISVLPGRYQAPSKPWRAVGLRPEPGHPDRGSPERNRAYRRRVCRPTIRSHVPSRVELEDAQVGVH